MSFWHRPLYYISGHTTPTLHCVRLRLKSLKKGGFITVRRNQFHRCWQALWFLKVCGKFGVPTPYFKASCEGDGQSYIWSFTTSHWTPSLSTSSTNPQGRVHFNWKIASSPGTEPINRLRKDISVVNLRAFLLNQPCQVLLGGHRGSTNSRKG